MIVSVTFDLSVMMAHMKICYGVRCFTRTTLFTTMFIVIILFIEKHVYMLCQFRLDWFLIKSVMCPSVSLSYCIV